MQAHVERLHAHALLVGERYVLRYGLSALALWQRWTPAWLQLLTLRCVEVSDSRPRR